MVGQNIGKYQVLDRIGRGGMGTVYRAMDETLRREVAIKVLNAELSDPAVAKRFQAEAITVARLNHPGIATIYELFQHDGQWLMVMEFVRGENLEALVTRKGPLALAEAVDLTMQALAALAHAHSLGVVHRDLKPANLMTGPSGLVKIMDFGIARVSGTEHLTSAGFMMGTPAYMAPEQVLGEDIDARADIYAMGAVLFYLLTADLPFKGKSPFEMAQAHLRDQATLLRAVRADMPEWVEQVIDRTLQREPAKRFASAPLFHEALRRGLSGLPVETSAAEPIPADLMVTAPPGTMPIVGGPVKTGGGSSTPPPLVDETAPTMAASIGEIAPTIAARAPVPAPAPASTLAPAAPVAPPVSEPVASKAPAAARSSRAPLAIAAAVVVLVALGGFVWLRGRPAESAQQTPSAETPAPVPAPAAVMPPADTSGVAPAADAASAVTAPSLAVPSTPSSAVSSAPSAAPAAGVRGSATPAPREGRAAAVARASAPANPVKPASDTVAPPETFRDVRLLVVTGKKADERTVILRFGYGQVAALSEREGTPIVSIGERDITYAVYARAQDPRWSPVLAAPPPDTDFPGGLFRSSRHWLTLQSRSAYLILRLNDADWRRVIDTVNRHADVKVDTSAPAK